MTVRAWIPEGLALEADFPSEEMHPSPPILSPQISPSHKIFLRLVILTSDKPSSRKRPGHPAGSISVPVLPQPCADFICCCLVTRSCPTLCNPMDCSPPGSFGIFQASTLEWVAISYSRGPSQLRIVPTSPILAGGFFTTEPPGKLCPVL